MRARRPEQPRNAPKIPARYSAAAYMNASGFYVAGLTAHA